MEDSTSALPVIPSDQIAQLRAFLAQLAEDARQLADASANDANESALDRLADACETLATMTGPLGLSRGDLPRLHDPVMGLLHQIEAILDAGRWEPHQRTRRHVAIQAALEQTEDTLHHLAELTLASIASPPRPPRRSATWGIPLVVVAIVSILMIGLLVTISFAAHGTSTAVQGIQLGVTVSPGHHLTASPTNSPGRTPGASTTPTRAAATGTPFAGTPSPIPGVSPTPNSSGQTTFAVAPTAIAPCVDAADAFTLSASHGPQALSWTAQYDTGQVKLDHTHGVLQPGQSLTISVLALNNSVVGQITIVASGLPSQSVSYNATGC